MIIQKNKISKLFIAALSGLMISTVAIPAITTYAETNNAEQNELQKEIPGENDLTLTDNLISESDVEFLNKVASIADYFYLDENDNSQINLSADELVSDYNFSITEARTLLNRLDEQKVDVPSDMIDDAVISPAAHVESGKLYISNFDLQSGAFAAVATAATAGPAALKAAFITASSVIGGPVGTVISTIMAAIGGPGLIDIAGHITTALVTGEGVYIGVQARYPFVDVGYWAG